MLNEYIIFDREQCLMEQKHLDDLALDQTLHNLEYASTKLDRLIDDLKTEERESHA